MRELPLSLFGACWSKVDAFWSALTIVRMESPTHDARKRLLWVWSFGSGIHVAGLGRTIDGGFQRCVGAKCSIFPAIDENCRSTANVIRAGFGKILLHMERRRRCIHALGVLAGMDFGR